MAEGSVTVRWMRYGAVESETFGTEDEAADYGVTLQEAGDGAVLGARFADGRTIERDAWPAFRDAQQRRDVLDARWRAG